MIAHIVLFSPKPTLTLEQKRSFAGAIREAGVTIPGIRRALVGRAIDVDAGYSRHLAIEAYPFAAILEFETREHLVAYLTHPLHARLGQMFWDYCERSIVTEVETRAFGDPGLEAFLGVEDVPS